ncbi:MAG: hypothetical protein P8L36_09285, partial [SAR324 cluster bacterium]|nr:hypothetical protein [SAR324 cluster bacterium]
MSDADWVAAKLAVNGIETNDADLTISGSVTLKDNASIQSSGGVINLNGSLALESGTVDVNSGTLNLSGGSVGEYGKLQVGGQATLNLGANLSASGTFNLHPHSVFNSGGNTLDASSGRLEIGGERSFDSIITNSSTSLQVNSYLDVSRTDSGTSTIGDLELIMLDGDSGSNSLNMSNMSLVVGGSASLDGKQIMLNNGNLSFQGSPSLSNGSSLNVSGGELILESGGTFSNTSLNLSSSVFKPSGTVLLEGSSAFNINETSSIKLQGATTYTQSGTAYWPSIDLNGNSLTLNVTKMYCCAFQSGGLSIRGGESLNSGTGEFTVDNPLTVEPGGTFTSGSGKVQIGGALTLEGDLVQGSGILNLVAGGTVGSTGRLDMSNSELQLGTALNITGTLVANSGSIWQGSLDLTSGTFEASGGGINLNNIITGSNTDFKLSSNTEISSTSNITFGTLDLNGKKLSLADGSSGLILPNTLVMNNAGSAIDTKSSNLTLSSPLQLDSGSITSTGGTLSFAGGLTLGSGGTLGVAGSTLSVNATLDLSAGTLSSNTSSVLKLQAPTTLTSSNPVSFGAVSFEGNVLTLGSSSTHLKITDTPLSLGGIPLETGPGSLTLSGALSLSNQARLNSSGGSITLESGGSVAGGSTLSLPNTTLVLQSPLSIASSTLKTSNTTFTTNSNALTLSGSSNLYIEGAQDLSGVVPDNTSVLRLTGDTTLNGSNALSVYSLELEDHALTLHNSMGGLSVSQAVLLNASSEQINSGAADLSLSGGITVSSGTLASSGGTVSSSSLTASGAGILNFQGGTLSLPNGASLASGATFTTSSTTIELGGNLDVSYTWASSNTNLSLTADAKLSSTAAVEAATLETKGFNFYLDSATTDLTISDGLTINASEGQNTGVGTGNADLTLNGPLTVLSGGISSSGGTLTFGPASGATSFAENTGMHLIDTELVLQANINLNYLKLTGTSSIQTNTKTLSPVNLEIGTDNELDLTNAVNSDTGIDLAGDSTITTSGDLLVKYISLGGFSLTLNPAITSLTAENIWIPNDYASDRPNYMASNGKFLAQGVPVTLNKSLWLEKGKLKMGGGRLSLKQGGGISGGGELDLSNSVLEISGQFHNNGGTFTTSGSTLRLTGNTELANGGPLTFSNYEADGWGLKIHDSATHLTLGGNVLLQPNAESSNDKALDFDG